MNGLNNILQFILAAICVGVLILISQIIGRKLFRFKLCSVLERFLVTQALGLAVISYIIFLLGLFGGIQRINFIIIFLISTPLLFFSEVKTICSKIKHEFLSPRLFIWFKNITFLSKIAIFLLITFLVINFIGSLTPPIARDAMTYHLKMPQYYIQTKYVQPQPPNIYSYFPALVEMLYTFGLILSNDYSAHLIHFYFGILCALTIFMFVRRISNAQTALFSTLIFYSLPIVSQLSSWAYVDLALCFFTLLAIVTLVYALENIDNRLIKLSAILFGFALGIKYLTFVSLYIILILFLIRYIKIHNNKRSLLIKQCLYFFSISLVIALPWYLRNFLTTGNPTYPFFYSIFCGPHWDLQRANLYDLFLDYYGMGRSLVDHLLLPWRLTIYGGLDGPFDGEIGILYFVLIPLLIWFRSKHGSIKYLLIYSAIFFFAWMNLSQQVRFLLPVLGTLSISLYILFDQTSKGKLINHYSMRMLAIGLVLFNLFLTLFQFQKYNPIAFIAGRVKREEFLIKHLKDYKPIQYINTHLPIDSKIYMVAIGDIGYYCKRDFIQESVFDYIFQNVILDSNMPQQITSWLKKQGVTHLLINEVTARRYIYPNLNSIQSTVYNEFQKRCLYPIYADDFVVLYKIENK